MLENNANSTQGVSANVDSYDGNHNKNGSSMMSEIFVGENVGGRDRDGKVLNRNGVAVDLVALGTVEDPYGEEIRQRTEGLKSQEELLGFLEGLNGKWGSSRKKRRIVDASMFGSALPIGWKLLLSLKKKQGHVWLYCRRYLSPSGRQFVSCKDISSYLLSLHCIQDTNKVNCAENNESINDANSLASVSIANVTNQDDNRKENLVCNASSLIVTSTSSNHEMQVTLNAGDLPEDKVGKKLYCDECKMTFNEKDDLLHHQSSLHRKKIYKKGLSFNDDVIVKEGNYEHMFTYNTFNEMSNYNGHIGAHERNKVKSTEESLSVDVGVCIDPSSFCRQPVREVMLKGSVGTVGNNIAETSNVNTSDHVGDHMAANCNLGGVDKFLSSNNENKSFDEGSVDARIPDSVAGISDGGCNVQGKSSECRSPFPFTEAAAGVMKKAIKNSATLEDSKQDRFPGTGLFGSDDNVETCDIVVNDKHFCLSMNELKRDAEKFVDNDSVFGFCSRPVGQENYSGIRVGQHSNFEVLSCENVDSVPVPIISAETWSDQNKESKRNMLTAHGDEEVVVEDFVPSLVGEYTLDGKCSFRNSGNGSSEADKDAPSNVQKEMQYGISSVPSWNEQASVKSNGNEEATCLAKEVGMQNTCKGSLLTLSDHERNIGTEHLVDKVCRRKMEKPEVDGVQKVRTSELFLSFGSHTKVNSDSVIGIEEKILQHCSPSAFETEKNIWIEDDVIRVISSAVEECKQEPSGSVLLPQSSAAEVSDESYTVNKISTTSVNDPKLHDIENPRNHKLSLSSGHLHTERHTNSDTVEQEKNLLGSFSVECGTEKTYGVQTNFSNNDSSAVEDAKRGKHIGFGLLDSSLNTKTCELGTSFSMNYSCSDWDGPRGNQVGNSGNDFIIGFGRNNLQPDEDVMAGGLWTTGQENVLQDSFTATTSSQVQPSSCFHAFDIMSDKDSQGLFEVHEKYNINTDVERMRAGRAEPVEYSFLGSNSSNAIPMESNIFSQNTNMEQELDSSFWLENDALMPNIADDRSKSSSVCVWCRNVFYHEPIQPEIEAAGAIGSMCPSCSARIPGHFNVL
ncbi:uncharacterized protein Fot_24646 [Forsythia ovata]|uniref:Uncharacterized protein n=1 Tax=Forsythia ovata TaxID=205694 RepID=A0ABD1U6U4_9LAMI